MTILLCYNVFLADPTERTIKLDGDHMTHTPVIKPIKPVVQRLLRITKHYNDWFLLGQRLGLSLLSLQKIKERNENVNDAKIEMLEMWTELDENASMYRLLEIIKSKYTRNNYIELNESQVF